MFHNSEALLSSIVNIWYTKLPNNKSQLLTERNFFIKNNLPELPSNHISHTRIFIRFFRQRGKLLCQLGCQIIDPLLLWLFVLAELRWRHLEHRLLLLDVCFYFSSWFLSIENGKVSSDLAQLLLKFSLLAYRVVKLTLQRPLLPIFPHLLPPVLHFDLSFIFLRLHKRLLVDMSNLGHRPSHILTSKHVDQYLVYPVLEFCFHVLLHRADTSLKSCFLYSGRFVG